MSLSLIFFGLALSAVAQTTTQQITIYGIYGSTSVPTGGSTTSTTASTSFVTIPGPPQYTGLAAYNPIFYLPPALPDPVPGTTATINVPNVASAAPGLSIPQRSTFFGFSIEMSVATQLIGKNSSILNVPFLNLMSTVAEKAGSVHVRVGGNTQEFAFMVDSLDGGNSVEKDKDAASGRTDTPVLAFTSDLIYMLNNVSSLVDCKWYLSVPFNDTSNFRFEIAEVAEVVLGDNLLGLQAGNEPDLYGKHGRRENEDYSQWDYFGDFALLTQAYMADTRVSNKSNLIAPSIQGGNWDNSIGPEIVWNTGFVDSYGSFLNALSVERYPSDNCAVTHPAPGDTPNDPIKLLPQYLSHSQNVNRVAPYLNSTGLAQGWGKPFLMFETNTASCGGFPGISDAFVSALWAIDYGMQLAYGNFSGALFHAGGQNVTYNPFTAAPTNESTFHQWTIGPIFYSAIVMAEAFGGPGHTSQVLDVTDPNNAGELAPASYAVYDGGVLARMVLINFMTDPSGSRDYIATVNVGGQSFGEANGVPAEVKVKYLVAPSVSEKDNITWAGQTLGGRFQVDGRWKGAEVVQTVPCDQTTNACTIRVPAPGVALVFISDDAKSAVSSIDSQPTATFSTSVATRAQQTASIDPSVLATSNGMNGTYRGKGIYGTSKGNDGTAGGIPYILVCVTLVAASFILLGGV